MTEFICKRCGWIVPYLPGPGEEVEMDTCYRCLTEEARTATTEPQKCQLVQCACGHWFQAQPSKEDPGKECFQCLTGFTDEEILNLTGGKS